MLKTANARVMAKGVIAFDVLPGGDIHYSNGSAIFRLSPGSGKPTLVEEAPNVQQILALAPG